MRFENFMKEKIINTVLLLISIMMIEILLLLYDVSLLIRTIIFLLPIIALNLSFFIEYKIKQNFYNQLIENLEELDEKYLISEIAEVPDFEEGRILKEIIQESNKSMLENVNKYKYIQEDYKDYIELWIHEIKMPIATSKMIIENNKTKASKSIDEELDKIENYIEQALFYARSNTAEKDYIIAKVELKDIVNIAILKNKKLFISEKINLKLENLEQIVYTDGKWVSFILNQLIQNAIKYSKTENKKIKIFAEEKKEQVELSIKDNGLGIPEKDLKKVFEKGFTGENGRIIGKKSTGIGLYLCKKLCDKLNLGITITSVQGAGTEVKLAFPKSSFINMGQGDGAFVPKMDKGTDKISNYIEIP